MQIIMTLLWSHMQASYDDLTASDHVAGCQFIGLSVHSHEVVSISRLAIKSSNYSIYHDRVEFQGMVTQ